MSLNKRNHIYNYILLNIFSGEWKPGDFIFSENQFTIKFDCSRITVRAILQELVSQNILNVERGKGYYVTQMASDFMIGNSNESQDYTKFQETFPKDYNEDVLDSSWLDHLMMCIIDIKKFGVMFQRRYSKDSKLISFELLWVNKNQVVPEMTGTEHAHLLPFMSRDQVKTLRHKDIIVFNKSNTFLDIAKELGWGEDFPIKLTVISNNNNWITLSLRIDQKQDVMFYSSKIISVIHENGAEGDVNEK